MLGVTTVIMAASATTDIKAETIPNEALIAQALLAQSTWNDYVNKTIANQAALSNTNADQILAMNRYELIYQAALAHHFASASPNPVTMQATLNWAELNLETASQNPYALAVTLNPYYYRTYGK